MDNSIRLPVRQLVEFILRSGDIDSRYVEKDRMQEGARIHRVLQKNNARLYDDYKSEVSLSEEYPIGSYVCRLEGRADGVFRDQGRMVVDEIKTTVLPISGIREDTYPLHWAQVKCYAYMLVCQRNEPELSVQLTYFNLDTEELERFRKDYSRSELELFMHELMEKYLRWIDFSVRWKEKRDASIQQLAFPFPSFRAGQRNLAGSAYRAIETGRKLFAQAPTGTGKTVSALFPAVKAMGEGKTSKIFYLTAKTITRQVAEEAVEKMRCKGLQMKALTLTAKEKICFCEKPVCTPDSCAYAKGHFDRVNEAALDVLTNEDTFTRGLVETYARRHTVCPFELSLDLSLWADCVICDYNYVFDPQAYLRRFFTDNNGDYVFLIDEAHNLVDRAREMFSSQLRNSDFNRLYLDYKGKSKKLEKALREICEHFQNLKNSCGEAGHIIDSGLPRGLLGLLQQYSGECEFLLKENRALGDADDFLRMYFETLNFQSAADWFDERFVTFVEAFADDVTVKLFCLDPSGLLNEAMKRGGSAVLFSATLTPLPYFREILGGGEEDWMVALDSPFESGRLNVLVADAVSTRYARRKESVGKIVPLLRAFVTQKTGNYILYFPSYSYMQEVYEAFCRSCPDVHAVLQESAMDEGRKEDFLGLFEKNPNRTLAAFCVLGGIFSEGIDLKGDRLIGAAIVSVGLPQISVQQNIIRDYFSNKNGMGYEYAYMYPGMNKVLQAAGRVIRAEDDAGSVLLIDDRFSREDYRRLYPQGWFPLQAVRTEKALFENLQIFWNNLESNA